MSGIKKSILRLTENVITLCKETSKHVQPTPLPQSTGDETDMLKLKYEFMLRVLDREKERDKTIESKASMFIGSTSIMGTIMTTGLGYLSKRDNDINIFSVLCLVVLIYYMMRSITYALLALRKRTYYYLAKNDIENATDKKTYYEGLINSIDIVLKQNQQNTNSKVDYMELAQKNFFCFWISSFLCAALVFLYKLLITKNLCSEYIGQDLMPWIFAFLYGACLGYLIYAQLQPHIEEQPQKKSSFRKWLKRKIAYIYKTI